MKRDLELVKKILEYFDDKTDWKYEENFKIDGYDNKLVSYHVDIMYEAGLINGEPDISKGGRIIDVIPFRLTWEGHEFLDNIKDQSRWSRIKTVLKEKGGNFSFELVKQLAIKIASEQLLL